MYHLLRQKASALEPALHKLACELIGIPSPSFSEGKVADTVISALDSLSYDRVFKDNAGNVVGCIFGRNYNPTLLLISHMDTCGDDNQNNSNRFRIENGLLYGTGAA
ncbi:MAG TPA: hypothetical protein VHP36_08965, partial [Chitinispirillaceae bacterium]|nr:hypothetical protein [Chitinispirillaceae bacterium]